MLLASEPSRGSSQNSRSRWPSAREEIDKAKIDLSQTRDESPEQYQIELVVIKITKDHIEVYLSEPKYKKSELQSSVSAKRGRDIAAVTRRDKPVFDAGSVG